MGAVHGVYLKYVGMSAISYACYFCLTNYTRDLGIDDQGKGIRLFNTSDTHSPLTYCCLLRLTLTTISGYSTILNAFISFLFKLETGMILIGKDPINGKIPWWSYVIFFPFHIPTMIYTYVHTKIGKHKDKDGKHNIVVPVASEVHKGWWVGGCYSHKLNKDWGGVIDLTVEFPERCISRTKNYLLVPTWDGVPPTPFQLESAANFAVNSKKDGDVLIHCAHGRGRSTTMMCAALVKAGMYNTWQDAFEKGIKPRRPVCKLNSKMKKNLSEWQSLFNIDSKKKKM